MSKLSEAVKQRRYFNINSDSDVKVFKKFIVDSAWGSSCCPFLLEEPFLNIPDMIRYKITNNFLGVDNDK
jgi:hypothetical protein